MVDSVINMLNEISGLQDDILNIIGLVMQTPLFILDPRFSYFTTVAVEMSSVVLPIGLTLMTFFFLLGFFNKAMLFEFTNWENILKMLFRFIVAKVVMENYLFFLYLLSFIIALILTGLANVSLFGEEFGEILDTEALINEFEQMGFLTQAFSVLKYIVVWVIMLMIRIGVNGIIIGRFVELCIYTFIAPIPIATMISDEFSSIAFKFFQKYCAILLQGVVIVLMCFTYLAVSRVWLTPASGYASGTVSLIAYLLTGLVLLFMLLKSGDWAKSLVGL